MKSRYCLNDSVLLQRKRSVWHCSHHMYLRFSRFVKENNQIYTAFHKYIYKYIYWKLTKKACCKKTGVLEHLVGTEYPHSDRNLIEVKMQRSPMTLCCHPSLSLPHQSVIPHSSSQSASFTGRYLDLRSMVAKERA